MVMCLASQLAERLPGMAALLLPAAERIAKLRDRGEKWDLSMLFDR